MTARTSNARAASLAGPGAASAVIPDPDPAGTGRSAAADRRSLRPSGLTVLYDEQCPVCRRARSWVEGNRLLIPVRFLPAGSPPARRRFPRLDVGSTLADVTVVTDEGAVLRGERAWIAVLWAVASTRRLAVEVAHGRRTRTFRRVKGATDTIRRLSADHRRPGGDGSRPPAGPVPPPPTVRRTPQPPPPPPWMPPASAAGRPGAPAPGGPVPPAPGALGAAPTGPSCPTCQG